MDHALLVGINAYPFPNTLHGCIDDVTDIKELLTGSLGFKDGAVVLVTDADATAAALKSALAQAVKGLDPGDRFLFWYSGHGAQLTDGDAATDVICPVDFAFTPETSVAVADFHAAFSAIPKGVIALWGSDSCHSGDLEKDFYRNGVPRMFRRDPAKTPVSAPTTKVRSFKDISAALPNVALISGCRSDQTSADADIDGRYNGAMTYYLLQSLRTPGGLALPLTRLVPAVQEALQTNHYTQLPQLSGPPSEVGRAFLRA
jgi:uncharacterized caspase-like protein